MSLATAKALLFLCSILVAATFVIVQQLNLLNNPKPNLKGLSETHAQRPAVKDLLDTPKPTAKGLLTTQYESKSKVKDLVTTIEPTMTGIPNSSWTPNVSVLNTLKPRLGGVHHTLAPRMTNVPKTSKPKVTPANNNSNMFSFSGIE